MLHSDAAEEMRDRSAPGFRDLLADLGIASYADLRRRVDEIQQALPEMFRLAEAIMAANEIGD